MSRKNVSLWEKLRSRLAEATSQRGKKADLAREFNVTRQAVAGWLSGTSAPTADTTLRLLEWVTAEEGKQNKNPERAETRPGRKTQLRNPRHENHKSGPP